MGKARRMLWIALAVVIVPALLAGGWAVGLARDARAKARYAAFRATGEPRPFLRTPEDRFANLPDYPFAPHYVEIDGLRLHYLDEGPRGASPVLLLHGEPSWSYLYRKMIPPIADAGHRVIAPDLIGFGRSDKLVRKDDYTYQMHVDTVAAFVRALDLRDITLFCQDWGGLIGLRVAVEDPDRFARIVASNTALPGTPPRGPFEPATPPGRSSAARVAFFLGWWLPYSQLVPSFRAGTIVQLATVTPLTPEVVAAYDAPFPDAAYLVGARRFPLLVPSQWRDNTAAWRALARWEKPFLTLFSANDPIMRGGERVFQRVVPGAQGQPHAIIPRGGHFVQEDQGDLLARHLVAFIAANPSP